MKERTVVRLPSPEGVEDALTAVLRRGTRDLIRHAVEAEVAAQLGFYEDLRLADGRRRLVRHGHGPEREIVTGIGAVGVRRPKVRDRGANAVTVGLGGIDMGLTPPGAPSASGKIRRNLAPLRRFRCRSTPLSVR